MQISCEKNGDIQIVAIKGRIDGSNAKELENALRAGLNQPSQKAVLDFQDVGYISSAGLRVVLALAKQLEEVSGELVLCALRPEVLDVFKICGFDDILSLAGPREEALKALGAA